MIELKNLTKNFGLFTAVDDVSLKIPSGEFFGFLGPNGAGKTTTIKMMTGLFTPTSGQIIINGFDVVKQPLEAKSSFGYIPDHPYLYDKLTGREFIYYVGGLYKMKKDELKESAERVIDLLELAGWVDNKTEDYSQGMRQRVTFAAAFVHNPRTIIIDEPMVGLDPRSARIVKDTLKQKAKEGVSIFMSTHILEMVDELCDRIGIINKGKMIFLDTKESLHVHKSKYDGKLESVFLELTKEIGEE
ncbi:MAG: ABC transporter ATP-binding protein [Ignavibacteriales bacterium]|nr:ABC transporter ATP-binding protein [Ignavibacteriales bacterium]